MSARVLLGDCVELMRAMPDESVDAVVTDPPYGIGFMGHEWDQPGEEFGPVKRNGQPAPFARSAELKAERQAARSQRRATQRPSGASHAATRALAAAGEDLPPDAMQAGRYDLSPSANRRFQMWCEAWATECLRVLKPGGHLVAFGGTRTYHRLAAGIEDAGFEIRDQLTWMFGQGFPKSHNLHGEHEGWGSALKPGHEPIVLARKPLIGTVAANVLEHGTGAINVDGCRIGAAGGARRGPDDVGIRGAPNAVLGAGLDLGNAAPRVEGLGRWPANVVLDERAAEMLDEQTGEMRDGVAVRRNVGIRASSNVRYSGDDPTSTADVGYGGSGGASRFFYCAKTSPAERNAGLEHLASSRKPGWSSGTESEGTFQSEGTAGEAKNVHPTVKPIALMRWLVRLVTPPSGLVLDPFTGSGTTGCACVLEGFDFIGLERDEAYHELADARIEWWSQLGRAEALEAGHASGEKPAQVLRYGEDALRFDF